MTATELRGIGDFLHAQRVLQGLVLPEFDIPCGFRTLWRSMPIAWRFAFVSHSLRSENHTAVTVLGRTNPSTRRIESTEPAAPKSP